MFRKAVELAKKDHDAEEVETLQHGLGVWRSLSVDMCMYLNRSCAAMCMYVNLSCADIQAGHLMPGTKPHYTGLTVLTEIDRCVDQNHDRGPASRRSSRGKHRPPATRVFGDRESVGANNAGRKAFTCSHQPCTCSRERACCCCCPQAGAFGGKCTRQRDGSVAAGAGAVAARAGSGSSCSSRSTKVCRGVHAHACTCLCARVDLRSWSALAPSKLQRLHIALCILFEE